MTYGSLFTGIGGLDLGLDRAGMECRWQIEIDPFCQKVLEKQWPGVKRYGDIRTVRGTDIEPVDLICGGFPCQDLSQAGKRAGIEGSRSGLWFEYARLVGELRPRWVLIENVPGLLVHDAMRRVVGELARLGYVGCWRSLRAAEFGASHLRKRVFIVAYSGGVRPVWQTRGDDTDGERLSPRESQREEQLRFVPERCSGDVAHRDGGRYEVERIGGLLDGERAACGYDADGRDEELADAATARFRRRENGGTTRGASRADGRGSMQPERDGGTLGHSERARWAAAGFGCDLDAGREPEAGRGVLEFAPGPADARWKQIITHRPDLAPAIGGRLGPRFVEFLMNFPIGWTETEDDLQVMRSSVGEKAIHVLQSGLRRDGEAQRGCEESLYPQAHTAVPAIGMRTMRNDRQTAGYPSQGSGLEEQRSSEPSNIMHKLSCLIASCSRGDSSQIHAEALQILRSPEFESNCLQQLPGEDQEAWRSLPPIHQRDCLVESIAWAASMSDRTKRLGRLGNAVVPQCAEWLGRRIIEHEGKAA